MLSSQFLQRQRTSSALANVGSGAKLSAGPVTSASAATERWRVHLQEQVKQANALFGKAVRAVHDEEKRSETLVCALCHQNKYRLDFTQLECCPERHLKERYKGPPPPHRFCTDCLTVLLARQREFNARGPQTDNRPISPGAGLSPAGNATTAFFASTQSGTSALAVGVPGGGEGHNAMQHVTSAAFHIVVCPLCRTPNVLIEETRFHEGFARRTITRNGVMRIFVVHSGATRLLKDNFGINECYENQRRPFFGSFSGDSLLTTDWRGNYSTAGASEIENLEEYFRKPNSSWVWLEDWTPDETLGGANGWMYANRWPDSTIEQPMKGWSRYISLFNFVRRRRLLRTRIRLNADVVAELAQIQTALQQARSL